MLYTLTFSKDGQPLRDEQGRDITRTVESDSRTGAIYHADTVKFCADNGCRVRRIL